MGLWVTYSEAFERIASTRHRHAQIKNAIAVELLYALGDVEVEKQLAIDSFRQLVEAGTVTEDEFQMLVSAIQDSNSIKISVLSELLRVMYVYYESILKRKRLISEEDQQMVLFVYRTRLQRKRDSSAGTRVFTQMEISLDADDDEFLPTDLRHPDRLRLVRHLQLDVRQTGRAVKIVFFLFFSQFIKRTVSLAASRCSNLFFFLSLSSFVPFSCCLLSGKACGVHWSGF
ncbi:hypothetical protein WR25_04973 [Diploscapter pachys]|uniref:Uncharacterized protein n=1 Tax=Diploscapter pachys TaxID=2018661 RepID=A0A2A2KZI1_9BILA|nr:hypothetical protein WR25_04973 [Diploscapter pachys]